MTEPRYPGPDRANGEHRDGVAVHPGPGYGKPSEVNGRDPRSAPPPPAGGGGRGVPPGGEYDVTKIGGSTTYGSPRGGERSVDERTAVYNAPGSRAPGYPGGAEEQTRAYPGPGGGGGVGAPGGGEPPHGSMYRVARDGSVKKLGAEAEASPAPPINSLAARASSVRASVSRGISAGVAASRAASGGPRRARLQLKHIDPWSVMKFSLAMAVALFFVWMIAVGLLYGVLSGMGVFDKINSLYDQVHGGSLFTGGFVLGTAAMIGAVNIVLFSSIATVGAYIYNLCADLVGGIEVTLSEGD